MVLEEGTRVESGVLHLERAPKAGANTRLAGEDAGAGAEVLPAGRRLGAPDLALAAAVGHGRLSVRRQLRVAVLSTGDEVRPAGSPAAAHQVWDANRPMLCEMLRRWDMLAVDLGHAGDDRAEVAAALDRGAAQADAILTSGGASAGDEDHVAALLEARGALEDWRIAVKPGRPLALGAWGGRPVFGLPGNPVAAFVCTLIFARPALRRLAGEAVAGTALGAAPGEPRRPLFQFRAASAPRKPTPVSASTPTAPWTRSSCRSAATDGKLFADDGGERRCRSRARIQPA